MEAKPILGAFYGGLPLFSLPEYALGNTDDSRTGGFVSVTARTISAGATSRRVDDPYIRLFFVRGSSWEADWD